MPSLRPEGYWRGRVTDAQGQRHSASFTTKEQAVRWEKENKQRVKDGLEVDRDNHSATTMTVGEFFPSAALELYGSTKSAATRIWYAELLAELIGPSKRLTAVSGETAQAFQELLLQRGMKPASLRNYTSVFNTIMQIAHKSGYTITPVECTKVPYEQSKRTRVLSHKEENKIVSLFRSRGRDDDADLVSFLIWSGLRWSEAMRLTVEDINFDGGYLHLFDTKNGEDRVVPLTDTAAKALRDTITRSRLGESDRVFDANYHTFRERLNRVLKRLRIEGVRIHAFRHTTGTRLAENNMSLPKIAKFLGHKTVRTTERYTHIGNETMKELGAALSASAGSTEQQSACT